MKKRLYRILILLSLAGYGWLGWNVVGGSDRSAVPTVCLFKEVTGFPCPSCGTTRSLMLLVQGQISASFMTNPFGMLLALLLAIVPLWIVVDAAWKNDSFYRRYVWVESLFLRNGWIAASAAVVVVVNWVWNIAKGM